MPNPLTSDPTVETIPQDRSKGRTWDNTLTSLSSPKSQHPQSSIQVSGNSSERLQNNQKQSLWGRLP